MNNFKSNNNLNNDNKDNIKNFGNADPQSQIFDDVDISSDEEFEFKKHNSPYKSKYKKFDEQRVKKCVFAEQKAKAEKEKKQSRLG